MPQEVIVKANLNKGYENEIQVGAHKLKSDIPEAHGGTNSGPNPHDLLLASLGACTSITLQMFAQKRNWEIKHLAVKLNEETVDDPNAPGKKISKIKREIEVEGNLTAEQVDSLKAIADKCQIHKLLVGAKEITTTIKEAATV